MKGWLGSYAQIQKSSLTCDGVSLLGGHVDLVTRSEVR